MLTDTSPESSKTDKPESLCVPNYTLSRLNLKLVLRKTNIIFEKTGVRALIGGVGWRGGGDLYVPCLNFKTLFFLHTEEEALSLWLFYYYAFLHFCHISIKALRVISVKFLLTASNITALQNTVVMRIEDMITLDESI